MVVVVVLVRAGRGIEDGAPGNAGGIPWQLRTSLKPRASQTLPTGGDVLQPHVTPPLRPCTVPQVAIDVGEAAAAAEALPGDSDPEEGRAALAGGCWVARGARSETPPPLSVCPHTDPRYGPPGQRYTWSV